MGQMGWWFGVGIGNDKAGLPVCLFEYRLGILLDLAMDATSLAPLAGWNASLHPALDLPMVP